jgi:deazaflavin-dependent oxidoreductase (nitroreductase family)
MSRATAPALLAGCALLLAAANARSVTTDDLRTVGAESTLELTTTGRTSGQARTVTIWFVREGDHIYVQSGKEGMTDWYRNALKTPAVGLRIGTLALRGRARPIDDAKESERIHELFAGKYLSARMMGWFGGGFGHGRVLLIEGLEATR